VCDSKYIPEDSTVSQEKAKCRNTFWEHKVNWEKKTEFGELIKGSITKTTQNKLLPCGDTGFNILFLVIQDY